MKCWRKGVDSMPLKVVYIVYVYVKRNTTIIQQKILCVHWLKTMEANIVVHLNANKKSRSSQMGETFGWNLMQFLCVFHAPMTKVYNAENHVQSPHKRTIENFGPFFLFSKCQLPYVPCMFQKLKKSMVYMYIHVAHLSTVICPPQFAQKCSKVSRWVTSTITMNPKIRVRFTYT